MLLYDELRIGSSLFSQDDLNVYLVLCLTSFLAFLTRALNSTRKYLIVYIHSNVDLQAAYRRKILCLGLMHASQKEYPLGDLNLLC